MSTDQSSAGTFETLGRKLDKRPEIHAAEEAIRQAREQLEQAQQYCQRLRDETAAEFHNLREKNCSDLMEGTLQLVRKHPGAGLCVAGLLGYFLGRLFRR